MPSKATVLAVGSLAVTGLIYKNEIQDSIRYCLSLVLYKTCSRPKVAETRARQLFKNTPIPRQTPKKDHSHGQLAADRLRGEAFMAAYCLELGLDSIPLQRSHRETGGNTSWYWPKDISIEPSRAKITGVTTAVDVDYYVPMHKLVNGNYPTLLYTLTPERAARAAPTYRYCFERDNVLTMHVNGGGEFHHMIHNHNVDVVMIWHGWRLTVFDVEKRRVRDDWSLVLYTPRGTWWGPMAVIAQRVFVNAPVSRLKPVDGDFVRLAAISAKDHIVSTARVGSYACGAVSFKVDAMLKEMGLQATNKLTAAVVVRHLREPNAKDDYATAMPLLAYYRQKLMMKSPEVYLGNGVMRYQFGEFEPSAKPGREAFMTPFIHQALVPDMTVGNEQRSIDKRLTALAKDGFQASAFSMRVLQEFTTMFVPERGMATVEDEDGVMSVQKRMGQRQILDEASLGLGNKIIAAMLKKEAYQKIADPRNISTLKGEPKLSYSMIIHGLSKVLKPVWYAFSHTPAEIDQKLARVLEDASMAVLTDFTRFDGTVNEFDRQLERAILLRAFPIEYHPWIIKTHEAHYRQKGRTTHGVTYETLDTRLSGSAGTSFWNSVVNAFVAFHSFRSMGLTKEVAYSRLGIYGGDDGVTADVVPDIYRDVSLSLGKILKCEVIERGDLGIVFLDRWYSRGIWHGIPESMCGVLRQLSKFHTGPVGGDAIDKLQKKCLSYYLTDANTPMIGAFVTKVLEIVGHNGEPDPDDQRWFGRYDKSAQFNNECGDWMEEYVQRQMPDVDQEVFNTWLQGVTTRDELLSPPLIMEPIEPLPVDEEVVLEGEILPPKEVAKKRVRTRRRRKAKKQAKKREQLGGGSASTDVGA